MVGWNYPAAFWWGLSLIPIVVFYFLRIRFREHPVSSIYLWLRIQNLTRGGSQLRRRSVLLLMLQLLTALAAVFAFVEPFWYSRLSQRQGIIYLLDISASMAATDVREGSAQFGIHDNDRLNLAKTLIRKDLLKQSPQTFCMIFLCSDTLKPLAEPTADHRKLLRTLQQVKTSSAGFDETEITEELKTWLALHRGRWKECLVTDGGLDLGGRKLASVLGKDLRSLMVGNSAHNIGITGLRLVNQQAEFSVMNNWPILRRIQISLYRDTKKITEAQFAVNPGFGSQRMSFPGPILPGVYKIQINQRNQEDILAIDNQYYLAVNQPRPIQILCVGKPDPFLEAVLDGPDIHRIETDHFPPGFTGEGWDLIIVESEGRLNDIPRGLKCNLLCIRSVPMDAPVLLKRLPGNTSIHGTLAQPEINEDHPLLRFVDWQSVQVDTSYYLDNQNQDNKLNNTHSGGIFTRLIQPRSQDKTGLDQSVETNPSLSVLATTEGKPVLAAWEKDGQRYVVSSFDLYQSNLGLSGAFPVLMQNILQWCVPQYNNPLAYTLTVGQEATLTEPPLWQIIDPNLTRTYRKGSQLTIEAEKCGVFAWGRGVIRGVLVANLPATELDIAPKPLLLEKSSTQIVRGSNIEKNPLTDWALIAFLLGLCGEWLLWRGIPGREEVASHGME
jgi:hypothetical protein